MRIVDADGPRDCSASTNALADDYDRVGTFVGMHVHVVDALAAP